MPNQTPEQQETVAQLELGRTERIEKILESYMTRGFAVIQDYREDRVLPYSSTCCGLIGRGDSRREADAQLAQKLSLTL